MYDEKRIAFNAEQELKKLVPDSKELENRIIDLFLELPKERQKAVLSDLWSEFKPEKPDNDRRFYHVPY